MAYKIGEKNQHIMFPPVIDDYIKEDDPVRVYDAFVDSLDLKDLGIDCIPKTGAPTYFPKNMLKLALYGPSYGILSSRKLERACHHNLSFIWLMDNLKPDYRTIARFRAKYADAIKKVLKECVRLCIKMDLIEGNTLFIDGSKFRANASIDKTYTQEGLAKELKRIDKKIDKLINECTKIDKHEEPEKSHVKIQKKIKNKQDLANHVKSLMQELKDSDKKNINITDPDSVKTKSHEGIHNYHNVQVVTDQKHGLIVSAEAVSQHTDSGQLSKQIENATENLNKKPKNVCADAGYFKSEDLDKIDKDITVIVPSIKQTKEERSKKTKNRFDKDNFQYDKERNEYICPEGKRLTYKGYDKAKGKIAYRADTKDCRKCKHRKKCTSSKTGRSIKRLAYEETKLKHEAIYKSDYGQNIFKHRKEFAERPQGHIKHNLNVRHFLLRGIKKVNAEASILATCFNIRRLMTIIEIPELILRLKTT